MERPVSFSAEDIRDEKVCLPHCCHNLILQITGQSPPGDSAYRA